MLRLWPYTEKGRYLRLEFTIAMVRRLFSQFLGRPAYGPEYGWGVGWVMNDEDILSDKPSEVQQNTSCPWEPWRCTVCKIFVYNLDDHGKPIPGAPSPRYISRDYPVVCLTCWQLYVTLDHSDYFRNMK
jgi:hypothetical protein